MAETEKGDSGSHSEPEADPKLKKLIDLLIDSAIKAAPKVSEELVVDVAREALGLSKKSDMRKGSKAYKMSIFMKEITPTLVWFSVAILSIYTVFFVIWRYLGI